MDEKLVSELQNVVLGMVQNGLIDNLEQDDLKEVLRIISTAPEDRENEGIFLVIVPDENGNDVAYLDGGRGIRLKLSKVKK